jgi:hypothetical protein
MAYRELVREPQPLKPWWKDVAEVHLLLRWLVDTSRILTLDEAVSFAEKPQKWNPERDEMLREEELEHLADEEAAFEDQQRYSA